MVRRRPPLNPIRAFETAARHMSFTAAAEELGITQIAVSRQVRVLEDYLEVPLFERSHRSIRLTAEGARLFPATEPGARRDQRGRGRYEHARPP